MNRWTFCKYVNDFMLVLFLTVFILYDSFPHLQEFLSLPRWFVATVWIFGLVSGYFLEKRSPSTRFDLYFPLMATIYLTLLIVALFFLSGKSSSGITIFNPALWIMIALTLYSWLKGTGKGLKNQKP